jgi:hypothetical protein
VSDGDHTAASDGVHVSTGSDEISGIALDGSAALVNFLEFVASGWQVVVFWTAVEVKIAIQVKLNYVFVVG